jgi:hypothetical protein
LRKSIKYNNRYRMCYEILFMNLAWNEINFIGRLLHEFEAYKKNIQILRLSSLPIGLPIRFNVIYVMQRQINSKL